MQPRHMMLLAAVTAVILGLGWQQAAQRGQPGDSISGQPLFAGLEDRIAELRGLALKAADGGRVNIRVVDGAWQVDQLHGWPADPGRLRSAVLLLAQARVMERKTSRPELYHRLGVEDVDSDGAANLELELEFTDDSLGLILGKTALGGSATYVRRTGEAASLLVNQGLALAADPLAWVDTRIPALPVEKVLRVQITHPDGETLTLERSETGGEFQLQQIPRGRLPAAGNGADAIAAALEQLRFENLRPRQDTQPDAAVSIRYSGSDGPIAELLLMGSEPAWARIRIKPGMGESSGEIRLEQWEFVLPAEQLGLLTRRTEDLLVPIE